MSLEERTGLLATAASAVELQAAKQRLPVSEKEIKEFGDNLARSFMGQSKGSNYFDVTDYMAREAQTPNHDTAIASVPRIVEKLLKLHESKLSSSAVVNERAVTQFASSLYSDIVTNGLANIAKDNGIEIEQQFLKTLHDAKHPTPVKPTVQKLAPAVIRLAAEKAAAAFKGRG